MKWIFDEETDMEREMLGRIMPKLHGPDAHPAYNLDIEVTNGVRPTTADGEVLDTTVEHPARLVSIDWDNWSLNFALLDEDYEPTGDFVVLDPDVVTIRVS